MTYALECKNIIKSFNGTLAVRDISLVVRNGQLVTLLGPSGCGKTTTLRLIAGFETPDSGKISINGAVVAREGMVLPAEKRRIGMVFQEYALFPHLNVADNIAFGLQSSKVEKQKRMQEMLSMVGLDGMQKRMPYELSGGQQQRVALARALAPQPQILLLDEPFSNLDTALRTQVRADVRAIIKQAGITCVFVTHDQEEALSLSDRVAVIFDGHVAQIGSPQEVYNHPSNHEVAAFIGESNFLPGEADGTSATCILGQLQLANARHGPVELLIRPEMLLLGDYECEAVVEWVEFYGHDQRVGIVLNDNNTRLVARADAVQTMTSGQTIGVAVRQAVQAFDVLP